MRAHLILPGSSRVPVDLGGDPYEALLRALRACEAAGLSPARVDADDWVTLGDVGARLGASRETVRLWAAGRCGPGGFPPPLNPGRETRFFSWVEVAAWLRTYRGHPADPGEPVLAAMNLALQLRRMAPDISRLDAVLRCVADRAAGYDEPCVA
jgi:hypothetical protein